MTLWNNQYRIETARRKGHDYRSAGWYFITICTQNKICAFGHVLDCETMPSLAGKIVVECWQEIPKHYPGVVLDEFGLMPNHVHGIVVLQGIANGLLWEMSWDHSSRLHRGSVGAEVWKPTGGSLGSTIGSFAAKRPSERFVYTSS